MSPHNAPVPSRVYGHLRLSFISTCISYLYNIRTTDYISSLLDCYNSNTINEIIEDAVLIEEIR